MNMRQNKKYHLLGWYIYRCNKVSDHMDIEIGTCHTPDGDIWDCEDCRYNRYKLEKEVLGLMKAIRSTEEQIKFVNDLLENVRKSMITKIENAENVRFLNTNNLRQYIAKKCVEVL